MKKLLLTSIILAGAIPAFSQTYTPKVSKDSIGILNNKEEVLKAHIKLIDLKLEEAEEEEEVENLRLKLLNANDEAKESADKINRHGDKSDSKIDLNTMNKLAKKAKDNREDAQKALERFNKQVDKVKELREKILAEERKLNYKKPLVAYYYK